MSDATDNEITRLRAEVERLTRERDAAFADRDAEERDRVLLSREFDVMVKRQPYDNATPYYPEKVTEKGILERLRGLGFGSMEREVAALIDSRQTALDHAEAAERKLAMAVEAAKDSLAHLVAATSLLERGGKKAAPSDKMFAQMLVDYKNATVRARATLAALEKNDE